MESLSETTGQNLAHDSKKGLHKGLYMSTKSLY